MTQSVSSTNLAFAGQALKYMETGTLKEKSLFQEVKSSAVGSLPFALAFDTVPTLLGARKIKKAEGITFKEALGKKTADKVKSQGVRTHGKFAKFFKLDKLSDWYSKTKFGGSKFGGLFKGASTMFLATGLFELMEVIPAFKNGGVGAGTKQVVKSAGNVVVDGLMYTAGLKLGTTLGASIGGPVGALVGGACGMVLGGTLNTLGRGLLDKVLGKNFSVKKHEEEQQAQAQAIAQDDAMLAQMKDAVQAQIVAKAQSGKELTDDDKQMLALAQAVDVDSPQVSQDVQSAQTLAGAELSQEAQLAQGAEASLGAQSVQNLAQTNNVQNVQLTPEEQEEAELVARLQKVDNPQIDYQIPNNFSVEA